MYFLVFLANRAKKFYGNSGDYHLSIGIEKSRFWALNVIFDLLGPDKGRCPTGTSKPDQKVDPPGGHFGSPVILYLEIVFPTFFDLGTPLSQRKSIWNIEFRYFC